MKFTLEEKQDIIQWFFEAEGNNLVKRKYEFVINKFNDKYKK
jgi:hypothetical protein